MYVEKSELGRVLRELEQYVGNREEGVRTTTGGDFNARTGRVGGDDKGRE